MRTLVLTGLVLVMASCDGKPANKSASNSTGGAGSTYDAGLTGSLQIQLQPKDGADSQSIANAQITVQ